MIGGIDDLKSLVRAFRTRPLRVALWGLAALLVAGLGIVGGAALGVFGERAAQWIMMADDTEREVEFWRSIKASGEIDLFKLYVEKFPEGTYVALAEREIAALEAQQHVANLFKLGIIADDEIMWTRKDGGRDQSWVAAKKRCDILLVGNYDDWRLPTIDELESLYDPSNKSDVWVLGDEEVPIRVRDGFRLTIPFIWSDVPGSFFEFDTGRGRTGWDPNDEYRIRTLCVRD